MKQKLEIPKFENENQERQFWSNLDLTDYFDPSNFEEIKDFAKDLVKKS